MNERLCGGAIFQTPDGDIIFQRRENRPDINSPGVVHVFGGKAETGETGLQAMRREIPEETDLDPSYLESAQFIGRLPEEASTDGVPNIVDMYLIPNCPLEALGQDKEGAGFVIISRNTDLEEIPLSPLAGQVLKLLRAS